MPLPTLTWNISPESLIAASTPTYADFLNAIETRINASTYWRVNSKNLDVGNSRGYIELAPKSATVGVTEGRLLVLFSTGTVSGSAGTERPVTTCRAAPWNSATTGLTVRMWVGFSPDADSSVSGPASDPWTSATPYGATPRWSKLFSLNASTPNANSTIQIIESAEGIALYWAMASGTEVNGIVFGRLLEAIDGETAHWSMHGLYTTAGDVSTSTTGWNGIPNNDYFPPISVAYVNFSGYNSSNRTWMVAFKGNVLVGLGRNWSTASSGFVQGCMSGPDGALLQSIILGGGNYYAGASDAFQGLYRQVRFGPAAYRGQKLYSGGVEQAIHLNYAAAATGAKIYGLWFDNFR